VIRFNRSSSVIEDRRTRPHTARHKQNRIVPKDWKNKHFAALHRCGGRSEVRAEFDPMISELEGRISDEEAIGLCQKITRGKLLKTPAATTP
jgi:hypothetical protein